MKKIIPVLFVLFVFCFTTCHARIINGDERTEEYLPLLKGKRVALFSNHTGMVGKKHVLDILLENNIDVKMVYSPEHGFRGTADAGELVNNLKDERTGVPIVSMYGNKHWKEDGKALGWFDVLVVDIQDVGLRFYTYYVTMCHLIDACNEFGGRVVILDRPNPNGHYVDGPTLDMNHRSGVGWLPIPVVHGMTLGELAMMANGEGWFEEGRQSDITIITCRNYNHQSNVDIKIAPSPNLPNIKAILLYPSLCYFEATQVSVGRGTKFPFQVFGHPDMKGYPFTFTPRPMFGAKHPLQEGQLCQGRDLRRLSIRELRKKGIDLSYLIEAYKALGCRKDFMRNFFEKLIGNSETRQMIEAGCSAEEIRQSWQLQIKAFKQKRKHYLLYNNL